MSQTCSVVQIAPLADTSTKYLNDVDKENESKQYGYETNGGILSDIKHIWKSYGPRFIVVNSKTGVKISAWTFGSVAKDPTAKVVCVEELPRTTGKLPLLVIGLECNTNKGMICIFNISGSRVLRAIHICEKVTSLHVLGVSHDVCPLPGPLRAFDGILSVGTTAGNVLLLDICRQTFEDGFHEIRDEVNACQVNYFLMNDIHSLELHKQIVSKSGDHLAIHMNATDNTPYFILKGPKGEDRVHVNKLEVTVSALHYCPQLGSLLVGYNFGAWQLWNLINMQLIYTSPIYEENIPITHFAVQEPSDDPRAFCYIWAVYSNTDLRQEGFPVAVLYSLNYKSKEWHEGYGILYQDLVSCSVRIQTDLTLIDKSSTHKVRQGARCLRVQAINKCVTKSGSLQEYQEETVSMCSIVWTGWSSNLSSSSAYLILFDLNQWYKEQMPHTPSLKDCESYMTYICLNKVIGHTNREGSQCLDVRIDTNTLSQFVGSQKLEEHYYPSSFAFQLCTLNEDNIIVFNNQGSQRALLSHLESNGPLLLVKPTEYVQQASDLGLFPLFVDISNNKLSHEYQRELLLCIALEHQLLGWLCRCASSCSSGTFSSMGFTLHSLLNWGWQRAQILKENTDKLTIPLFDYSGLRLDCNTHNLLNNCVKQLRGLTTLFGFVVHKLINFVFNSDTIKQQFETLQMISLHLEVLQWLLNVGLLPESPLSSYPRSDEYNRISAPYPIDELTTYYNHRRTVLQSLNKEQFSSSGSFLFIDNLIDLECGGHKLQKQWENDGGNGLYPPPSLQALLRTYLIDNVKIPFKHSIIMYVFLDLAMTLDQNRYKPIITHLIKFPAVFQLSPSIIKITQAFWQLDHGDFSTAMEQLLDPLVCAEDLKIWHHRIVLKALLTQDQHNFALLYLQVRQPAVNDVQDLCTILSLYVANDMIDEAFHFQRQNRNHETEEKLLEHFYKDCDKNNKIPSIHCLPLSSKEEKIFMEYLQKVNHPNLSNLQMPFYIHHSRYMDAFEQNDKLNSIHSYNKGLKGQEDINDFIIEQLHKSIPEISKNVMDLCRKEKSTLFKEARPEPFSVSIHNSNNNIKYKSFLHAGIAKAKEIWSHPILDKSLMLNDSSSITTENMPFLNTPKALLPQPRVKTPVIYPKVLKMDNGDDGPSPPKKFKLSPRATLVSSEIHKARKLKDTSNNWKSTSVDIKIETPIIKRKTSKTSNLSPEKFNIGTPQSILKIRNLVRYSESPDSTTGVVGSEETGARSPKESISTSYDASSNLNLSNRKISFGLTPRKSIPRTPKSVVRFDISQGSSESSPGSNINESILKISDIKKESTTNPNVSQLSTSNSKNSSGTSEEIFYSTDTSPPFDVEKNSKIKNRSENIEETEPNLTKIMSSDKFMHQTESPKSRKSYKKQMENSDDFTLEEANVENVPVHKLTEKEILQTPFKQTPKSRKSYRESLPVRSSPRLNKSLLSDKNQTEKSNQHVFVPETLESSQHTSIEESLPSHTPQSLQKDTPTKLKLKAKKSLSRRVLEKNTCIKMTETLTTQSTKSFLINHLEYQDLEMDWETSLENNSDEPIQNDETSKQNTEDDKNETIIEEKTNVDELKIAKEDESVKNDTFELNMNSSNESSIPNPMNVSFISNSLLDCSTVTEENKSLKVIDDIDKTENILSLEEVEKSPEFLKTIEIHENINEELCDGDKPEIEATDQPNNTVSVELKDRHELDSPETASIDIYEDLSSDHCTSVNPEMNVFEITDDLDVNKDMSTGKNILDNSVILSETLNDKEDISDSFESKIISEHEKNIEGTIAENSMQEDNKTENAEICDDVEIIEVCSSSSDDAYTDVYEEYSERSAEFQENSSNSSVENQTSTETSDEDSNYDHDNAFVKEESLDSNPNSEMSLNYHKYNTSCGEIIIEEIQEEEISIERPDDVLFVAPLETILEEPEITQINCEDVVIEESLENDNIAMSNEFLNIIPEEDEVLEDNIVNLESEINQSCEKLTVAENECSATQVDSLTVVKEVTEVENIQECVEHKSKSVALEDTMEFHSVSRDILDESEAGTTSEMFHSSAWLNRTDILDTTARRSTLYEPQKEDVLADILDESVEPDNIFEDNIKSSTPARRSKRSSSLKLTPMAHQVSFKRRTRRSSSFSDLQTNETSLQSPSLCDITDSTIFEAVKQRRRASIEATSSVAEKKESDLVKPSRRILRSASTDTNADITDNKRRTRKTRASSITSSTSDQSKSDEIKAASARSRRKRSASLITENMLEQSIRSTRGKSVDSTSAEIEDYSASRRLTRGQVTRLQKTLGSVSTQKDISGMNPIVMLDKQDYKKGKINSDEEKTMDQLSLSSISGSHTNLRSQRYSKGKNSITSEAKTASKKRSVGSSSFEPTGIYSRTRQRSKSTDDAFMAAELSPPKLRRTRKNSRDSDEQSNASSISQTHSLVERSESVTTRLRTRSNSASEGLESPKTTERRTRRQVAVLKPKLSLITEEQNFKCKIKLEL